MIEFKGVTVVWRGQLYQKDEASFRPRRLVPINVKKLALWSKLYYLI